MSIFSRLAEKSWEGPGADAPDPASYRPSAARVGVIVYFALAWMIGGMDRQAIAALRRRAKTEEVAE